MIRAGFTLRVRTLSLFDRKALQCVGESHSISTAIVATGCGIAPTAARTMLRRLERWGLVGGMDGGFRGGRRWWCITDAGRAAISGADDTSNEQHRKAM